MARLQPLENRPRGQAHLTCARFLYLKKTMKWCTRQSLRAPEVCPDLAGRGMPRIWAVLGAILLAGCSATVTHQSEQLASTGIRYYNNAPYLLIYSDGRGGLSWQVIYLPDQSEVMTATTEIQGGATQMTLYFQNGALSGTIATGDTTAIPKAVISTIQSALPLLTRSFAEGKKLPNGFPAPYLYKLVVRQDVVHFIGGQGNTSVQVPINTGPATTGAHP